MSNRSHHYQAVIVEQKIVRWAQRVAIVAQSGPDVFSSHVNSKVNHQSEKEGAHSVGNPNPRRYCAVKIHRLHSVQLPLNCQLQIKHNVTTH